MVVIICGVTTTVACEHASAPQRASAADRSSVATADRSRSSLTDTYHWPRTDTHALQTSAEMANLYSTIRPTACDPCRR
jgi:hypothetical protein